MMSRAVTVAAYLASEETNRPRELAYGIVREPAAPGFAHQIVVGRLHTRLDRHVRRNRAGVVVMSPIDVVLDAQRNLVVQPDIVFVRAERLGICRTQIWGPPDLVVEILSMGNARRDRTVKVEWYRRYGVRECWLVDAVAGSVEVIDLATAALACEFRGRDIVRSAVLSRMRLRVADIFDRVPG
jgi:Uma2 family endonuclease